ncbi:hypothetical protein LTR37_003156 [Vermiconidia calcicola]|uniref:Uncharacterized protein n=1 Tax=Vermiconidia calcicola TaxID=1690605 RepID=A0ACC3NQQ6_9PEZI|nr:hypothetical protein LTR37_003156 [Vermiconidia calcicola]
MLPSTSKAVPKGLVSKTILNTRGFTTTASKLATSNQQQQSSSQQGNADSNAKSTSGDPVDKAIQTAKKKSTLEQDEELRQKMAGLSGEGGEAGVEYENGEPVAMKRSVKNNMFRYI